jgi:hypothetical protein
MVSQPLDDEFAYAVIEPHFDAVRDHYAAFEPEPGSSLDKVRRTKLVVDPAVRDSPRHYAACRDDGLLIVIAPQAVQLEHDPLVALLCHEFGHATDFLYPGQWAGRRNERAVWVPENTKKTDRIRRMWSERSEDQVEWDADSIAYAVTGHEITYCGACMVQCFSGGKSRPGGLR